LEDPIANMENNNTSENQPSDLGNDILKMLSERTKNPGDAYVLLQQLSIFVWHQYKIDWNQHEGIQVAGSRKQRCMDYISHLIDAFTAGEAEEETNASSDNPADAA
jgi:hypothetical protein